MTSKIYESIKSRTPEDIHLNIKNILQRHIGADNFITKEEISNTLFGRYTDTYDRQIRDAVAELVIFFDEHIVTNTVTGGYYYAANADEIDCNIADLSKRKSELSDRIEGLKRARGRVFKHGYQPETQKTLFGGRVNGE